MNPRLPASGFTLIELLVTLVIAGILAAIALPSFQSTIESVRVRSTASDLYAAVAVARSEAIKRNTNVTLSAKGDWASGWQVADPATGAAIEDHAAISGITVSGPGALTYQPSGRIQGGANASFSIVGASSGTARCVAIDLSGRPSTKSGSC